MMKYGLLFAIIVIGFTSLFAGGQSAPKTNTYVAFDSRVKERSLKAGGSGSILFTLTPQKGIHVNVTPPLSLSLDSASLISTAGKLRITKLDTLLDSSKPIIQPITLSAKATAGPAILRGTLTYFYCSDSEGWCSKFNQPFEVKISVAK